MRDGLWWCTVGTRWKRIHSMCSDAAYGKLSRDMRSGTRQRMQGCMWWCIAKCAGLSRATSISKRMAIHSLYMTLRLVHGFSIACYGSFEFPVACPCCPCRFSPMRSSPCVKGHQPHSPAFHGQTPRAMDIVWLVPGLIRPRLQSVACHGIGESCRAVLETPSSSVPSSPSSTILCMIQILRLGCVHRAE